MKLVPNRHNRNLTWTANWPTYCPREATQRQKLSRLIKDNPDVDLSDKGELIYKQHLISQSHVADLFDDALATKRPVDEESRHQKEKRMLQTLKLADFARNLYAT